MPPVPTHLSPLGPATACEYEWSTLAGVGSGSEGVGARNVAGLRDGRGHRSGACKGNEGYLWSNIRPRAEPKPKRTIIVVIAVLVLLVPIGAIGFVVFTCWAKIIRKAHARKVTVARDEGHIMDRYEPKLHTSHSPADLSLLSPTRHAPIQDPPPTAGPTQYDDTRPRASSSTTASSGSIPLNLLLQRQQQRLRPDDARHQLDDIRALRSGPVARRARSEHAAASHGDEGRHARPDHIALGLMYVSARLEGIAKRQRAEEEARTEADRRAERAMAAHEARQRAEAEREAWVVRSRRRDGEGYDGDDEDHEEHEEHRGDTYGYSRRRQSRGD